MMEWDPGKQPMIQSLFCLECGLDCKSRGETGGAGCYYLGASEQEICNSLPAWSQPRPNIDEVVLCGELEPDFKSEGLKGDLKDGAQ
jgi:hypothetical protein